MVDALLARDNCSVRRIAFFTQRDAYGDAGFAGGLEALRRHGLPQGARIVHGRYERNTVAVEGGLADIMAAGALDAIIMVGAYAPCAAFIKKATESGLHPLFCNVSFVGVESLARELGDVAADVFVTQVVPHHSGEAPALAKYRVATARYGGGGCPGSVSLEGYLAAQVLIRGIERAGGGVTREALIDALEELGTFDVGIDAPMMLSRARHQACEDVWLTRLVGSEVVPCAWKDMVHRARAGVSR